MASLPPRHKWDENIYEGTLISSLSIMAASRSIFLEGALNTIRNDKCLEWQHPVFEMTTLLMPSLPTRHKWDETIYEGKLLSSLGNYGRQEANFLNLWVCMEGCVNGS